MIIMLTRENEQNQRLSKALRHANMLTAKREQGERCACCGRMKRLLVKDHNHDTKQQRGRVCYSCNLMIGYAEWPARNQLRMTLIIEYLKRHDPTHRLAQS